MICLSLGMGIKENNLKLMMGIHQEHIVMRTYFTLILCQVEVVYPINGSSDTP